MGQFFYLNVDQSLLDEQSSLISAIIGTLNIGKPFTIDPTDKTTIAALVGIEGLIDALELQSDQPEHPDRPDPYKMSRSELKDFYNQETGEHLDEDVFGFSGWSIFDGQEFVAGYLN